MLDLGVKYWVHVQNRGWLDPQENGVLAGTVGESLRIECFRAELINPNNYDVHIQYQANIENQGWSGFVADGAECGTTGQGLRLEAIQIQLTGADADKFDVNFRSHCQDIGDMNWATDGQLSGTVGGSLRLEALAIIVVPQGVNLGFGGYETFEHIVKQTPEQLATDPDVINPTDNGDGYGKYFTPLEFSCDCIKGYDIPDPCDGYSETQYGTRPNISPRLLEIFNDARERINAPICITCGTRCPSCNDYWGGVPDSCHLIGDASDSYCPSMSAEDYAWFLSNNYPDIGVRCYPGAGFVHIEVNTSLAGCGVYNQEGYYFM